MHASAGVRRAESPYRPQTGLGEIAYSIPNMASKFVAAVLLSSVIFPGLGHASVTETILHTPPAITESHGPIVASYSHKAATTTLSGIANATSTSSTFPTATAPANGTLPACKSIQYAFPAGTGGNATRAAAVREAYLYAFQAYEQYAFGYDELTPLNKSFTDDWCQYTWSPALLASHQALSVSLFMHVPTNWDFVEAFIDQKTCS